MRFGAKVAQTHRPVADRPLARAGQTWTVTVAGPRAFHAQRRIEQADGDVLGHVAAAPATDTGSVTASVASFTALSGPATSTVAGSAVIVPTT